MASERQTTDTRETIRQRLLEEGFDGVGFARPEDVLPASAHLKPFLKNGYHGDMGWLAHRVEARMDPKALWPEVQSVIVVAQNYGPPFDPMKALEHTHKGVISVYAWRNDYHDIIKKRLKNAGAWLQASYGAPLKVFVDTAPVMEKPLAALAGLGWQGKHTNMVSREFGSWTFVGVIFSALRIPPDRAEDDRCGTCSRCLDICPTNAFVSPYRLDARRCIAYLTNEHKGHIAKEFRRAMGNRIYGCDDCLAVCPWNKFAQTTAEAAFQARHDLDSLSLADYAALDDAGFRSLFRKSPIKRIGRDRFVRNVLIAIGNSGDPGLAQSAIALLGDTSALVRAMAIWACGQLLPEEEFRGLKHKHLPDEEDRSVAGEWRDGPVTEPKDPEPWTMVIAD